MQNIHAYFQIEATRALLKFIAEHNGGTHSDLENCLTALESDDIALAVAHAKMVKPHGMGGLTDWFPPVVFPNEDRGYVGTVLHALVNHWCHAISLSFPKIEA